jgi:hypothetical protein
VCTDLSYIDDNPKRENICRLADFACDQGLVATPIGVTSYHVSDIPATGNVGHVVKVGELNLLKYQLIIFVMLSTRTLSQYPHKA